MRIVLVSSATLLFGCTPSDFNDLERTDEAEYDAQAGAGTRAAQPADVGELDGGQPPKLDAERADAEIMDSPSTAQRPMTPGMPSATDASVRPIDADQGPTSADMLDRPEASTAQPEAAPPTEPAPPPVVCRDDPTEVARCGCAQDCVAVNADVTCVEGMCVRSCTAGFGDCNGDLGQGQRGDGCEADLRNDDTRCGSCDQRCTPGTSRFVGCQEQVCTPLDLRPMQLRALGRCLDVTGPSDAPGTNLQIWECGDGLPQQEWALTLAGEFRGFANKCLDVENAGRANGTPVQIWDCVHVPQQIWTLNAAGQLVGFGGKCVQVRGGISADGQLVEMSDCQDIPAQRWTLVEP